MTQYITKEQSVTLARSVAMNYWVTSEITNLCNAAIQSYIDSQEHIPKTDLENRIDAALDRLLPKSSDDQLPPLPEPLLHNGYRKPGPNQFARPESGFTADQVRAYVHEYGEAKVAQTHAKLLSDAIETVKHIKLEHESDHSEGAGFNNGVDACIEALQGCK
jgi:hypothetical protein